MPSLKVTLTTTLALSPILVRVPLPLDVAIPMAFIVTVTVMIKILPLTLSHAPLTYDFAPSGMAIATVSWSPRRNMYTNYITHAHAH